MTTNPYFADIQLRAPQAHRNIVVFPIVAPSCPSAPWLTLGEALERQFLTITEVHQGGSVPELMVRNAADHPVLLLDGEELIGAKQNRVLNSTILLKERSDTVVPVSCTERGRWSYVSAAFADAKVVMAHRTRARKARSVGESLARAAGFKSDQGEVWRAIAALHAAVGSTSPTGAMHDAFKARERDLEQGMAAFGIVPGQTGLLVIIDDRVAGFDLIPQPEVYARHHAKLVKSYILESVAQPDPRPVNLFTAGPRADAFLRAAAECPVLEFPSVGYGTDYRFRSADLAGSALVHDGEIVHAVLFNLANDPFTGSTHAVRSP